MSNEEQVGVGEGGGGMQRRSTDDDSHSLRDDVGVLEHKTHLRKTGWHVAHINHRRVQPRTNHSYKHFD